MVNELVSLLKTVNMNRVITHLMLASWLSRFTKPRHIYLMNDNKVDTSQSLLQLYFPFIKTVNMDRVITHLMLASLPSRCRNNVIFT